MRKQDRIDIEKLANEILEKIHPYDNWVGSVNDLEQFAEAAAAEANKRIDVLDSEVAELKNWKKEVIAVENEWDEQLIGKALNIQLGNSIRAYILPKINELQANNNDLREALEKAMNDEAGWYEIAKQALSAPQAESLQAHDAETIKRYADDLDNNHWVFIPHDLRKPLKEGK